MKIEIGEKRPEHFKESWPTQYDLFSHFEFAAGIPKMLFAVATVKENGKGNICLCSWSTFAGNGSGYYAVIGGVSKRSHTYQNILRTGEFTINFLNRSYYGALSETITHNDDDEDEFAAGGFTAEASATISAPRIKEAFLNMECTLEKTDELPDGSLLLIIGKVRRIALLEEFSGNFDGKYGENGFAFHIHSPYDLHTGEGDRGGVAVCGDIKIVY
jgi:flavin reductase (DIM6/NTAB) family NADH-FMN oxidoreductase RutF